MKNKVLFFALLIIFSGIHVPPVYAIKPRSLARASLKALKHIKDTSLKLADNATNAFQEKKNEVGSKVSTFVDSAYRKIKDGATETLDDLHEAYEEIREIIEPEEIKKEQFLASIVDSNMRKVSEYIIEKVNGSSTLNDLIKADDQFIPLKEEQLQSLIHFYMISSLVHFRPEDFALSFDEFVMLAERAVDGIFEFFNTTLIKTSIG